MQQSMRWRRRSPRPGTRAGGGVLALALLSGAVAVHAQSGGEDAGEAADADPTLTATLADEGADGAGRDAAEPDRFRPRWIEPQRGVAAAPAEDAAGRSWRRDAQIIVHAVADETRLATVVSDLLERRGSTAVERRVVDDTASTDQVRFFHAEDAAIADALAAELEPLFGDVRVRDLTFYRPQPASGSLEVWIR